MAISGDYGDVRPEYFRPPRSDAASQEFGVPLHEIHPASEMNDHNLLRKMLEDVEPGWEGHVLAGNCEYAEGEGDPDKINAANRLYALWERQGTESREDLSCDTEHAESEEEEQEEEDNEIARRSIVERLFKTFRGTQSVRMPVPTSTITPLSTDCWRRRWRSRRGKERPPARTHHCTASSQDG